MKFKKFITSISESVKELSLNRILDKISKDGKITDGERNFLNNYEKSNDRDYRMISKESVISTIKELKNSGKRIICNLHDRNGLIGLEIVNFENNFQSDECILSLKGGEKFKLDDRFLYNISWDMDGNIYYLELDSEYFEKIPLK
jgi:hypothetical protein